MVRASTIAASRRAAALTVLCVFGGLGWLEAQELSRSARGGALAKASGHQFEVFFYPTGLRVFPTDSRGTAVDASRVSGTATFYHPNSREPWFARPLHAVSGPGATSLDLSISMATVPPAGAKVEFEIAGLAGDAEGPAIFTVPVEFVGATAGGASAQPAPAPAAVAAGPAFVYGPGAAGFGYYRFAGPQTAPSNTSTPRTLTAPARTTSAARSSSSSSGGRGRGGFRDWSTGRNSMRIAKPWLNPRD